MRDDWSFHATLTLGSCKRESHKSLQQRDFFLFLKEGRNYDTVMLIMQLLIPPTRSKKKAEN